MKRRITAALLCLLMLACIGPAAFAADTQTLSKARDTTAEYLMNTVKSPQIGAIGGEWTIIGLARSGAEVPQSYYQNYLTAVMKTVSEKNGVLHERQYTEYSRVILALGALGVDARSVAGYDLTAPLGDYEKTVLQGINGPIWALLALDCRNYPMPVNSQAKTQASRQMYVDAILTGQLPDGGWSLTGREGDSADPDVTAMALQALSRYQSQEKVKKACDRALTLLSGLQNEDGGFSVRGGKSLESCVQTVAALCELKIPLDDACFVKNGKSLIDNLLTYQASDGGFLHTPDAGSSNLMAGEQAMCALAAAFRAESGKASLYTMTDVQTAAAEQAPTPVGDRPVRRTQVLTPGKTFPDIQDHTYQNAIERLAERGIINGKSKDRFEPDAKMTRAEFAAITVRALGLAPQSRAQFSDVPLTAWHAGYVGAAYAFGIVKGTGGGKFSPDSTITRQEAAVMVCRAAELCGIDTSRSEDAVRNTLAQFSDYRTCASWAAEALAFCYDEEIPDPSALSIEPTTAITRGEIAKMLYRLLQIAELL